MFYEESAFSSQFEPMRVLFTHASSTSATETSRIDGARKGDDGFDVFSNFKNSVIASMSMKY